MKLATYDRGVGPRPAVVVEEFIVDLAAIDPTIPKTCLSILESSQALDRARGIEAECSQKELSGLAGVDGEPAAFALQDVKLTAPLQNPRKLFCLAGNYEDHIKESGREVAASQRITPRVFMKPPSNTLCGPADPILICRHAQFMDYEAELAVVIGKTGKYLPVESALDYVAGYMCLNDVSERNLKVRERDSSEPWDAFFDWLNGKWMDHSAPSGPWIVTSDEIPDPQVLDLTLQVNGKTRQSSNTKQMMFTVAELVHYISQMLTLEPGDLIATGTPAGVGKVAGVKLVPGDVVEMSIERIGALRNPVLAEQCIQ